MSVVEFSDQLSFEPTTLIIEGFPKGPVAQERTKLLLGNKWIFIAPKGFATVTVAAPTLVFCAHEDEIKNLDPNDRRFFTLRLG